MEPIGQINTPWWQKHHVALGVFLEQLKTQNIKVRLVGGVVRDTLLYLDKVNYNCDIDLAIDVSPDTLIAICLKLNVQVIPTGIEFGTVTCILDGKTYEFTSLRKDVKTDGRKAVVEFSKSWADDAERRDFTINALYADWDGTYYDPTSLGVLDLKNHFIRFIGEPSIRIQEDYLRVLRFFRFLGLFEQPSFCKHSYDACLSAFPYMKKLSHDRKWMELSRTFSSKYALNAFKELITSRAIESFGPAKWSLDGLSYALSWKKYGYNDVFCQLLAGFEGFEMSKDLCIPVSIQKRLKKVFDIPIKPSFDYQLMYTAGKELYKHAYIKLYISTQHPSDAAQEQLKDKCDAIDAWDLPKFPINGFDLQVMGFEPGPLIGELLQNTESWWVKQNFQPTRNECIDYIRTLHLNKLKDKI